jgi:hypothetical protein
MRLRAFKSGFYIGLQVLGFFVLCDEALKIVQAKNLKFHQICIFLLLDFSGNFVIFLKFFFKQELVMHDQTLIEHSFMKLV